MNSLFLTLKLSRKIPEKGPSPLQQLEEGPFSRPNPIVNLKLGVLLNLDLCINVLVNYTFI